MEINFGVAQRPILLRTERNIEVFSGKMKALEKALLGRLAYKLSLYGLCDFIAAYTRICNIYFERVCL